MASLTPLTIVLGTSESYNLASEASLTIDLDDNITVDQSNYILDISIEDPSIDPILVWATAAGSTVITLTDESFNSDTIAVNVTTSILASSRVSPDDTVLLPILLLGQGDIIRVPRGIPYFESPISESDVTSSDSDIGIRRRVNFIELRNNSTSASLDATLTFDGTRVALTSRSTGAHIVPTLHASPGYEYRFNSANIARLLNLNPSDVTAIDIESYGVNPGSFSTTSTTRFILRSDASFAIPIRLTVTTDEDHYLDLIFSVADLRGNVPPLVFPPETPLGYMNRYRELASLNSRQASSEPSDENERQNPRFTGTVSEESTDIKLEIGDVKFDNSGNIVMSLRNPDVSRSSNSRLLGTGPREGAFLLPQKFIMRRLASAFPIRDD